MATSSLGAKLTGYRSVSAPLSAAISGASQLEIGAKLNSPSLRVISASITGEWLGNPIDLLAFLSIRSSGVFSNPAQQSPLPIIYGNWMSDKGVPCVNIDTANNLWLLADHPVSQIGTIYVDGSPYTAGADVHEQYVDATGKAVAVIRLPAKAATVSAQCLGKYGIDNVLLTNPTEIIVDVLTNVMGFNRSFIDFGILGKANTFFTQHNVSLRYSFSTENETVKSVVEKIARDSRSLYLSRKGKHSIKPRSVDW